MTQEAIENEAKQIIAELERTASQLRTVADTIENFGHLLSNDDMQKLIEENQKTLDLCAQMGIINKQ